MPTIAGMRRRGYPAPALRESSFSAGGLVMPLLLPAGGLGDFAEFAPPAGAQFALGAFCSVVAPPDGARLATLRTRIVDREEYISELSPGPLLDIHEAGLSDLRAEQGVLCFRSCSVSREEMSINYTVL